MTRDDIIRMAREATEHLSDADNVRLQGIVLLALDAGAAAAEHEACAKLCERMASRTQDIRSAALEMAAENIRARGSA